MKSQEFNYSKAMAQIEATLQKLRTEQMEIDTLAAEIATATELIKECKARLHHTEQQIATLFDPSQKAE